MAAPEEDLREIKRRLSPQLLAIPGVSGLGLPGGKFTVYLKEDSDEVRRQVEVLMESESPGLPYSCLVTGAFHPH